jgi:hypothetical protein
VPGEQLRIADPDALDQVAAISSAPLHLDGAEPFRSRHKVMKAADLLRR